MASGATRPRGGPAGAADDLQLAVVLGGLAADGVAGPLPSRHAVHGEISIPASLTRPLRWLERTSTLSPSIRPGETSIGHTTPRITAPHPARRTRGLGSESLPSCCRV